MKTKGLRGAVERHAGAIRKMGMVTAVAGGVITAAFALAVRTSGQFEQSMANVAAVAGATGEQLKGLSNFAREMGATTVFTASQAADAMYYLASAGYGVEKMMKALPGVLNLAAATGGELAEVTNSVVATLNQFELGARDAARVSNVFAAAIGKSQATMGKLAVSMSYAGAGANALGLSLEQTTALLSKIYDIGIDASMAGCYDEETEVLTSTGYKFWRDVTEDDSICTLNPKTKNIEYQKPTTMIREEYEGRMYRVKNKHIDLKVTPDHWMYVRREHKENFERIQAKDIFGKRVEYLVAGEWKGTERKEFILPSIKKKGPGGISIEVSARKLDMDLFLEFFGYWITEGWVTRSKKQGHYSIVICQTDQVKYEKMFHCTQKLFNCYRNGNTIVIHNQQLYEHLVQFGHATEKFIPSEFKKLSQRQLCILLDAIILGDGDYKRKRTIWTSSLKLRDDIEEIVLKTGHGVSHSCTIKKGEKKTIGARVITASVDGWAVNINRSQLSPHFDIRANKKASEKDTTIERWEYYKGKIYCAVVPNHIMFVRRNRKTVWCGNTQLRMAFTRLAKPTKEVEKNLKELGLTYDDVDPKVHNVIDTLKLLGDRGMDLSQSLGIFGTRAGATFLKLSQRASDIDKLTTAITGTDKAAEMADKMINTWQGTLRLLKSAIQEVQLIIGDALLPILTPMVKKFKNIVLRMGEWMKAHPKLTAMLIKFGAVLGPVLIALGALMMILPSLVAAIPMLAGAFAVLTGPVGLTVLAITGLVAAFAYFYKTNKAFRDFVNTKILPPLKKIWEGVKAVAKGLVFMIVNWKATWKAARQISDLTFEQIKKTVWKFFTDWSAFKAGLNLFAQFGKSLVMTWIKTWEMVGTILVRALSIVWAPLMKSLQWVADNIKYYFALGIEKARDAIIGGVNWITSMVFTPMANFFINVTNEMIGGAQAFVNFFIRGMNTVTEAIKPVISALSWFAKNILRIELPEAIKEFGGIAEVEFEKIEKLGKDALTMKIPESTLKEPAKFSARMSEAWAIIKDQYSKILGDLKKYVDDLVAEWENVTKAAGEFGVAVDWSDYAKKLGEVIKELKKAGVDTSALEKEQKKLGDTMAMGPMRMKEAWRKANEAARAAMNEYAQLIEEGLLSIWLFWDDYHQKKGPLSVKEGWRKNNEEAQKGLKKYKEDMEKGMLGIWLFWDNFHNVKGPMSVKEGWRKTNEEAREALKKGAEFEEKMAMDSWLMWDDFLGKKGPLSVKEGWKKRLVETKKGLKKHADTMEKGMMKVWLFWDNFHNIKGPLSIKEGWGKNDEAFKAGLKKYDEDMQAGALRVWLFWDDVLNKKGPLSVKEGWAKNNREQAEGLKKYQEELERGMTNIWLFWDNFHNVKGPMSIKAGWETKLEVDREALKKLTAQEEKVAMTLWLMWDDFNNVKGPMSMKEGWRKSNEEALKGTTELTEAQRKAAEAIKSIWNTFNAAVKSSFSDMFYDFMMGTKKSQDIWQAFCDSMVSSFVRAVADTIVEKLGLDKIFEGNILNLGNLFKGLGNLIVGVFKGIGNIIGGIFGGIGGALGGTTVVAGQLTEVSSAASAAGSSIAKFAGELALMWGVWELGTSIIDAVNKEFMEFYGTVEEARIVLQHLGKTTGNIGRKFKKFLQDIIHYGEKYGETLEAAAHMTWDRWGKVIKWLGISSEEFFKMHKEKAEEMGLTWSEVTKDMSLSTRTAADEMVGATERATRDMAHSYDNLSWEMAQDMRRMKEEGKVTARDIKNVIAMSANQMARAFGSSTQSMIASLGKIPTRIDFDVVGRLDMPYIPRVGSQTFGIYGKYYAPHIPSYQVGRTFVPQTGLAWLHRGEEIKSAGAARIERQGVGRGAVGGDTFRINLEVNVKSGEELKNMTITQWKRVLDRGIIPAMKMSAREGRISKESVMMED